MSHIRRNLQTAIQYETTLEMDEYLNKNAERIQKSLLQHEISRLANDPNHHEIILQNQKTGAQYTQHVIRNMTETNEIHKKLNRKPAYQTNTQPQTI